jgi:hypothetical protein
MRLCHLRKAGAAICIFLAAQGADAMAIDVNAMWNFSQPAQSEARFRDALAAASPDDALILQTQIARTWGLRGDFAKAREILGSIRGAIATASPEAQVRHALEIGRTYASPAHPPATQTSEAREEARIHYVRAYELARTAQLDGLAVDALHMMVMVDTTPRQQLEWNRKALALVEQSHQPAAKAWEGSLRNNVGYALHLAGRDEEAIAQYRLSIAAHEQAGRPTPARIGHWMIARSLRALNRNDEAIAIQLRLEQEWAAAGEPDPYVFEELEALYRAKGDTANADAYARKLGAVKDPPQ